ncbi:hypothetical protein NSK_002201 [Nannochloropsis salina CCMP1776]|jgi:hypothetical protein|uniref:Uncharacterized protein n=1 Tax=Nannochloropsis salina CCMP1776 TaxID=1027361 RepID=A0A4D9D6C4_9STRA|nr:hypothetical protein NSK_002201 [Nannochloropsis salina CCMP1776]|eukprot:TFJ86544.1 hypothetical protein NSK_002201 [Nannochloropsis salina CCMP1776]
MRRRQVHGDGVTTDNASSTPASAPTTYEGTWPAPASETSPPAATAAVNEEEALRAKALGVDALRRGDYDRAARFLSISSRLLPENADIRGLLNSALAGQARTDTRRASAHRAAAATAPPWSPQHVSGRFMNGLDAVLDKVWASLPSAGQNLITRYTHPPMRKPLAYVSILIITAATYRFVLRGPPLVLGHLPGDIYYNSGNVVVSAPLLSCFLASMAFSQVARLFQRR